jgi:hypothetical protein
MEEELIAPCGINCAVCLGHLRDNNKCPGCRINDRNKPKTRLYCKIKNCSELKKNNKKYCFSCTIFPCEKLKHLDKRYKTKYHMSMIENLEKIKKDGIKKFLKSEDKKWKCPKCSGIICCHNGLCFKCELAKLKKRKDR